MTINIIDSTCVPMARDIGNQAIQGMVVSNTLSVKLFTTNTNAAWAAQETLRKASYPLASVSFPANRSVFQLQVGDVFLFSCAKHGISKMVCRVVGISEEGPESEIITVSAEEDVFSISSSVTTFPTPTPLPTPITDYTVHPFKHQRVIEMPQELSGEGNIWVMPLAGRESLQDIGFYVYVSTDGGSSYSLLCSSGNINPFGYLTAAYAASSSPDATGFQATFYNSDVSKLESTTATAAQSGTKNIGLIEDEIITYQNITPVSGQTYSLTNIYRAWWGTTNAAHASGVDFCGVVNATPLKSSLFKIGADLYFKLVPFNVQKTGDLASATPIHLVLGSAYGGPLTPSNFAANGSVSAARYTADIILTWNPRIRGAGAGVGAAGAALSASATGFEGTFTVTVTVGGAVKRTVTGIAAATWTYTQTMNLTDNTSLAASVMFSIVNVVVTNGASASSTAATVTCYKES